MSEFFKKIGVSFKKMPAVYILIAAWIVLMVIVFATGGIPGLFGSNNANTHENGAASVSETAQDASEAQEKVGKAENASLPDDLNDGNDEIIDARSLSGEARDTAEEGASDTAGADDPSDTPSTDESSDASGSDDTSDASGGDDTLDEASTDDTSDAAGADDPSDADSAAATVTEGDVVVFETYTPSDVESKYYSDPGLIPLTTEYAYTTGDYSYFDDALVIGDSRMVGLRDYSEIAEHAVFAAMTGLTVYNALEEKTAKDPKTGKDVNAEYLLSHYKYGKVYLCVGINELGTGNTSYFADHYKTLLEAIRNYQPDAVIFIQSIMAVSAEKSDGDAIYNNININDKNAAIARFSDGKKIFYLNINEFFTDQSYTPHSGALRSDITGDQVHIYGRYYAEWADALLKFCV